MADLRRAAVPGALGNAANRNPGVLTDPEILTGADRFVPSKNPLAVAIDGPGLFVLRGREGIVYSRLGDFHLDKDGNLVDGSGRAVIGFTEGSQTVGSIAVDPPELARHRFTSFEIDEHGTLVGVVGRSGSRFGKSKETIVPIGQVALATFPVPERLQRLDETTLAATTASGLPSLALPGNLGTGMLRTRALSAGAVDIEGDLRRLWMMRRSGELTAALAGASDECTRTALGLVK